MGNSSSAVRRGSWSARFGQARRVEVLKSRMHYRQRRDPSKILLRRSDHHVGRLSFRWSRWRGWIERLPSATTGRLQPGESRRTEITGNNARHPELMKRSRGNAYAGRVRHVFGIGRAQGKHPHADRLDFNDGLASSKLFWQLPPEQGHLNDRRRTFALPSTENVTCRSVGRSRLASEQSCGEQNAITCSDDHASRQPESRQILNYICNPDKCANAT